MPATPFLAVCFPNMKHSYEAGDSSPVLEDARIMAKVYHCRIDELVGDETT